MMKVAWRSWGWAAVIILLTMLAHIPAMRAGFVWDDDILITENPMVKAGDGLYRFWFTSESADYRPLTWSLWWLEWRLWGAKPMGYHVVNVLLHAVNAVLVWLILRRLKIPGAWLAALVFAVHPVNAATVAWVSEQKNTFSMFFYALAILLYLRFDEEDQWRWYCGSLVAGLLALLTKTAVVMLPVVLLGCLWWRRGRVRVKDLLCSVPYFLPALVLALVTIVQHQRALAGTVMRTGGFASRLATAGWIPWFYLHKALLPIDLTVIYPTWEIDPTRWISYVPGVILVGCFLVFWWKRQTWGRPLLFGLGYFVVMLFPVLGFFDQAFYELSLVADHWQYYSIIGVIALVVASGERMCRLMSDQGRSMGAMIAVIVLMVFFDATWRRDRVYLDNVTLWQDNVAKNNEAVAHNHLGVALAESGQDQEAIAQYEEAVRIKPDYAVAHNNLGNALKRASRPEEAIGQYRKALQSNPNYAPAHNNLGNTLLEAGRVGEAIEHLRQALRIKPNFAAAHYNLGVAEWQEGRVPEAIGHWEEAVRFQPDYVEAHYNLGIALRQVDRAPEAIGHWEQVVRLKPDYPEAHYNLGVTLWQAGRAAEAIEQYEQALRIKPYYAEAHNNLGVALWQAGRATEAIAHYEQALQIKPDYAEAHNNLGLALAQVGRVQEAIGHYEQALRIKPDYAEARDNLARLRAAQ